jgi:hypothetical protein
VPEAAAVGTVKSVVWSTPPLRTQVEGLPIIEVGVLVIKQVAASLAAKPLPEIDTVAVGLTKVGLSLIEGVNATTVKGAVTVGPGTAVPSVKITVYGPDAAEVEIVRLPERSPLELIVHVDDAINPPGDAENSPVQLVGPVYPEPERATGPKPGPPLFGVKTKVDVTVKDATPESPVVPVNVIG